MCHTTSSDAFVNSSEIAYLPCTRLVGEGEATTAQSGARHDNNSKPGSMRIGRKSIGTDSSALPFHRGRPRYSPLVTSRSISS